MLRLIKNSNNGLPVYDKNDTILIYTYLVRNLKFMFS